MLSKILGRGGVLLRQSCVRKGAGNLREHCEWLLWKHVPCSREAEHVEDEEPCERIGHAESLLLGLLLQIRCGELALVNPLVPSNPSIQVFLAGAEMTTLDRRLERGRSTDFQRREVERIEEP